MTVISDAELERLVAARIRDIPDFPEPGVLFKDFTPLLADGPAFGAVVRHFRDRNAGAVDLIAGIEARGFIIAAAVASELGVGMVPIRKKGKLPGETLSRAYALEYGTAEIEVMADAFRAGQRVLVVDDVLATGGTATAACELVESSGGVVVGVDVLLELAFLSGRDRIGHRPVHAVLTV